MMFVFPVYALTAQAGDDSKDVVAPKGAICPVAPPSLFHWFAGGTVGYMDEYDTAFYSGHVGVDMNYQLAGWDPAVYLELGYFSPDECIDGRALNRIGSGSGYGNGLGDGNGSAAAGGFAQRCVNVELDVMPLTLNYKLERSVGTNLSVYLGAGAGIAFVDLEAGALSVDDEVFYAQVFGGGLYQVSEAVELFAGLRWIYMDDASFGGVDFALEDDVLAELGARINF